MINSKTKMNEHQKRHQALGDVTGSSHSRHPVCEQVSLTNYRPCRETQISAEPHSVTKSEMDWLSLWQFSPLETSFARFYESLFVFYEKKISDFSLLTGCRGATVPWHFTGVTSPSASRWNIYKNLSEASVWKAVRLCVSGISPLLRVWQLTARVERIK